MWRVRFKTPTTEYVLPTIEFNTKKEAVEYLRIVQDECRSEVRRGMKREHVHRFKNTLYVKHMGDDRSYTIFKVEK